MTSPLEPDYVRIGCLEHIRLDYWLLKLGVVQLEYIGEPVVMA